MHNLNASRDWLTEKGKIHVLDVMIVDDSPAVRKILLRVLKQANVPVGLVHEAGDGLEALEVLKHFSVQVIFCEVNMPNMDGIQLLEHVRAEQQLQSVPFILVTTEASQACVMQALALGATAYLKKPFTTDEIKAKLKGIV
jgi:two-component system chemotaxis response regulator CheY